MAEYKHINKEKLEDMLNTIKKSYYQILLIVEPPDHGMDEKLRVIRDEIKEWVKEIGGEILDMEELVMKIAEEAEDYKLSEDLSEGIKGYLHRRSMETKGPIMVENADILFSKEFGSIDVIHLLKYSSREIPIITIMPLSVNSAFTKATYGAPHDEDYKPDINIDEIIVMDIVEVTI